jgi:hypothetical protein
MSEGLTKREIYENLIIEKEQYMKDALAYEIGFMREFGELFADNFKAKIECIRLKKTIGFCQAKINRGIKINVDEMNSQIDDDMHGYYSELKRIMRDAKEIIERGKATDDAIETSKNIYHRIAKVLHPEINRQTENVQRLKELWNQANDAYYKYDVYALSNIEVAVDKTLAELGTAGFEIDERRIDEKIEILKKQIARIANGKPYTYGEILNNDTKKKLKKSEMQREIEDYKVYATNLEELLEQLLAEGGNNDSLW